MQPHITSHDERSLRGSLAGPINPMGILTVLLKRLEEGLTTGYDYA
jgi:hypothetical protein